MGTTEPEAVGLGWQVKFRTTYVIPVPSKEGSNSIMLCMFVTYNSSLNNGDTMRGQCWRQWATHWVGVLHSRSTAVSESTPEEEKQRQDEGSLRAPSPLVHGRISSDDSEAEGSEEPVEFPSSTSHPRPLAVSRFYSGESISTKTLTSYTSCLCESRWNYVLSGLVPSVFYPLGSGQGEGNMVYLKVWCLETSKKQSLLFLLNYRSIKRY